MAQETWSGVLSREEYRRFQDQAVIVAGVGRDNIGAALADGLSWLGAKVVMIGNDATALEELADRLEARSKKEGFFPFRPVTLAADLTDDAQCDEATRQACTAAGTPVAFISTIGSDRRMAFETLTRRQFRDAFNINAAVPIFMARDIIPHMTQGGSILLFTSPHGSRATDLDLPGYGMAKASLNKGVAFLAKLAGVGNTREKSIRVNAVEPSWIETPNQHALASDDVFEGARFGRLVPVRMKPEDIVAPTLQVLSMDLTSGSVIKIDAGEAFIGGEERAARRTQHSGFHTRR